MSKLNKVKKHLLITFDYELFLGNRSGFADDCMIEPTNQLSAIMNKHGVKAVFFVDTTYLLRLKAQSAQSDVCKQDFNKVANQLIGLVKEGHYVFPHIHPHWLDAEYLDNVNQWRLNDTTKYRFHNISEAERLEVFDGSVALLNDILHTRFPNYKVNAYRAGGWCIQPFEDFIPFFEKHEIKYEFSVLGGFYQFTNAQFFDFSNAPNKPVYRFHHDVCTEDSPGKFVQFNISSMEMDSLTTFLNKIWLKVYYRIFKDHTFNKGEGQPSIELTGFKPVSSNGFNLGQSQRERIAVELLTSLKLNKYIDFMDANPYMHFISHPKMVTKHNLTVFDKFLKTVLEKYQVETDFHMMIPE